MKNIVLIIIFTIFNLHAVSENSKATSQYTAKLYSEVLGRIPDDNGWNSGINYWKNNNCNRYTLAQQGLTFFNSLEMKSKKLSNEEIVLLVYRGILQREPDLGGYSEHLSRLKSGRTNLQQMASGFYGSAEFGNIAESLCADASGWRSNRPLNILVDATSSHFKGGTGEELQQALDSTPPGEVLFMAPRAVVYISKTIVIPPNVTLATAGFPSPTKYTNMARLVRDAKTIENAGPAELALVKMQPSAKLKSVWVDGQRGRLGYSRTLANVRSLGGESAFENNKISDTSGWTSYQAYGSGAGRTCGRSTITRNLVTTYGSTQENRQWSDGLSVGCENALVEDNSIIDPTDVGIVVFRAGSQTQKSKVRFNRILSAGRSAFGGITIDPLRNEGSASYNFTGTEVERNQVWTGPSVHLGVGISVGTRPWFGFNSNSGFGARVQSNHSGTHQLRANNAIIVSGIRSAFVLGNSFNYVKTAVSSCPIAEVLYDSFNSAGSIVDGRVTYGTIGSNCIGG